MPNEDKRRRLDGTTDRLSVAELIARREAETQPIPVVTAESTDDAGGSTATAPTVKFAKVRQLPPDSELHVTELLRREGRDDDPDRGGLSIGKLVAIASGGVVLCGSVAFGASSWLSTPDERPLADVRFDTTDRSTGSAKAESGTGNAASRQQTGQDLSTSIPSTAATQVQQAQAEPQRQASREIHRNPVQPKRQPVVESAPRTQAPPTSAPQTSVPQTSVPQTQEPAPETGTTAPETPPSTDVPVETTPGTTPPASSDTPSDVPSTPAPVESTSPAPSSGVSVGVDLDLGAVLNPLGEFDFFAPAE